MPRALRMLCFAGRCARDVRRKLRFSRASRLLALLSLLHSVYRLQDQSGITSIIRGRTAAPSDQPDQPDTLRPFTPKHPSRAERSQPELCCGLNGESYDKRQLVLLGKLPSSERKITIAIPTLIRQGYQGKPYLIDTLASVVKPLSKQQRDDIFILVYMADATPKGRETLLRLLNETYANEIDQGLIGVVAAPLSWMPANDPVPPSRRKDSFRRRLWRSRQIWDYTFILKFARGLSSYYMHIEDDVEAVPDYLTAIYRQIDACSAEPWQVMGFRSRVSFIGLLFKDAFLPVYARFLHSLRAELPCDLLLFSLARHIEMRKRIRKCPLMQNKTADLFKHTGRISSSEQT